jgi:hypothetical protein
MNFGEKVVHFMSTTELNIQLPSGISVMNPVKENAGILEVIEQFYARYYSDHKPRTLIVGINPGRLGAGSTGIPFTDTKRLDEVCGIRISDLKTHEPSSVFVYALIDRMGGPESFYKQFYITSMCPFGFLHKNQKGNHVNCNYYDYPELVQVLWPFMEHCVQTQLDFGINRDKCFVLGKKNALYVDRLNRKLSLFKEIIVLEHPRYIMQYKSALIKQYLDDFEGKLTGGH